MSLAERPVHETTLALAASAIDGALTSVEAAELEAHLATCPACARRAAAMRRDAFSLSQPLGLLPSPRVDDAIQAAIAHPAIRSQRYLLLAAAALVLLALFAALAVGTYLRRTADELPTTVVPSAPPAVAVPSLVPDASPVVVGESWETLDFEQGAVGHYIEAVTTFGSDLVGVGRGGCVPDFDNPTACYGAAWTATPGKPWIGAPDQPGLEVGRAIPLGIPDKGIYDVAPGAAGLVAIGYPYDAGTADPGVWRSADGTTWARVDFEIGAAPIDARNGNRVEAIAGGQRGYVIVGHVFDASDPRRGIPGRAVAWASPDGLTWTRAEDTVDMEVGPCFDTSEEPSCGGMSSVVATATGFLAVGRARLGDGPNDYRPAAWTSPDGLTWTRVDAGLDYTGWLSGVTVGGPGVVAVGTACQPDCFGSAAGGVAATSVDGSTWTSASLTGAAGLSDVAAGGGSILAVATYAASDGEAPTELQAWRSPDGVTWQRALGLPTLPDVTGYQSVDIAAGPDRAVIVGWVQFKEAASENFAYTSPPAISPAEPAPSPSASPQSATIWTRLINVPQMPAPGGLEGSPQDAVGFAGGYVAIGPGRTTWYSEDALTWRATELPFPASASPFGQALDAKVDAIASNGREVMIVGAYAHEPCTKPAGDIGAGPLCPLSPISWVSDDGRTWRSSHPWPGPEDPPGFSQGSEFMSVWAVPSGGWDAALGHWEGESLTGRDVWHSDDGVGWVALDPLPVPPETVRNASPAQAAHEGVADASGRRVAWQEWSWFSGGPASWLADSPDGRGWTIVGGLPPLGARMSAGLAPGSGRTVPWVFAGATTRDDGSTFTPTIWTSSDLGSWTTITLPRSNASAEDCESFGQVGPCSLIGTVDALVDSPYGYLAIGSFSGGQFGEAGSETWLSQDGTTWVDLGTSGFGAAIVADGPAGVIAIGVPDRQEGVMAVWRLDGVRSR